MKEKESIIGPKFLMNLTWQIRFPKKRNIKSNNKNLVQYKRLVADTCGEG